MAEPIEDRDDGIDNDPLKGWVCERVREWREFRDSEFLDRWKEYDRLWRGIWDASSKSRASERSRFIAPAVSQAVDSAVAEIEEATFGRGKPFALEGAEGKMADPDLVKAEQMLFDDLSRCHSRHAASTAVVNGAVYGTGIAEIIVNKEPDRFPAEQENPAEGVVDVGVTEGERYWVKWKTIQPNNFVVDPNGASIDEGLGCAIEEFVSRNVVEQGISEGIYAEAPIEAYNISSDLEKDLTLEVGYEKNRVKLTRYFGLVPRKLLDLGSLPTNDPVPGEEDEEGETVGGELSEVDSSEVQEYVEAIVVILNDGFILKAEENPYMMKDRPIVAFSWDLVPNRFWGRGIVEKGYNAQKALDAELRARQDALALTIHPMMAVDSSRMPRGFKFEVSPGRQINTIGNPAEILMPFTFGMLDQSSFAQADILEKMVFQATGALDLTGVPGQINGDATAAGMSMSLSGAIKRYKRTLLNFQEQFLIPALEKTMWRYIQYEPERYRAIPYQFKASSTLGLIAREYETQQLVGLIQTTPPESPAHAALMMAIVDNSSLPNRAELIEMMSPKEPTPEDQQEQQMMKQFAMRTAEAEVRQKEAMAAKTEAEAHYWANVKPHIDMVNAMAESRPDDEGDRGFKELVEVAKIAVAEKAIDEKALDRESNERITMAQMRRSKSE